MKPKFFFAIKRYDLEQGIYEYRGEGCWFNPGDEFLPDLFGSEEYAIQVAEKMYEFEINSDKFIYCITPFQLNELDSFITVDWDSEFQFKTY